MTINKTWHEECVRISEFKTAICKLELDHIEKGLTRHEYRIALSELLKEDLWNTYRPKKRKENK